MQRSTRAGIGAAVVTVAAIAVVVGARAGGAGGRPKVVLYGDSLSVEAKAAFAATLAPKADVVLHTFAGTAICDWFDEIQRDREQPADIAVLELVGNHFTRCMQGPGGRPLTPEQVVDRYRTDAERATRLLTSVGTTVYWVGGPAVRPAGALAIDGVRAVYGDAVVPAHAGLPPITGIVRYVDAGRAVLDARGRFTLTLPCLPSEGPAEGCVDRRIRVRSSDGVHFCPTEWEDGGCPVYSSGAVRFGHAMADPVARALGH